MTKAETKAEAFDRVSNEIKRDCFDTMLKVASKQITVKEANRINREIGKRVIA